MKKLAYLIIGIILLLFALFFLTESWASLVRHYNDLAHWWGNHKRSYYPWYLWFTVGTVVFPLMNRFLKKNIEMIKTFTHELTHVVAALLTFRKVHSFHAEEKTGKITSSGNDKVRFMVSLAPYCFPIYTFPLLMLRCLVTSTSLLPIIDVLIGFTAGLHIVCFKEQTGDFQSDITNFPRGFSYTYIFAIWVFDICLLLLSFEPSLNIFYAFKTMGVDLWRDISMLWR